MSVTNRIANTTELRYAKTSEDLEDRLVHARKKLDSFVALVEQLITDGVQDGVYMDTAQWSEFDLDEKSFVNMIIINSRLRAANTSQVIETCLNAAKENLLRVTQVVSERLEEIASDVRKKLGGK
jgi:hypothetical protein